MSLPPQAIAQLRATDHDDLRKPLIVGHCVCFSVAFFSVILRFWVRRLIKAFWGMDDWMSMAGMLCTAVYTALNIVMITNGMGRHIWWLDAPTAFIKMSLAAEIMYNAAIPFIKASILLLYHRNFPQRWMKRALLLLGSFILAYSIAQIFADIFQCTPVDSLWGASPKQYCINYPLLIRICGVINILTDVAILALPMPTLWKLKLSASRKRLLMITFLIGGIACVGAIVRLFYVDKIGNSHDPTWDYGIPALIANVELCVGVLAANLPTYRPLVTMVTSSRHTADTSCASKAAGSYLPVKDSLQVPLSSLFIKQGVSSTDLDRDDVEMLSGKHQMHTHISRDSGSWPKGRNNEIRVTTSFNAA